MRKPNKQSKPFASITIPKFTNFQTRPPPNSHASTCTIPSPLQFIPIFVNSILPSFIPSPNINSPKKISISPRIIINSHHNRSYISSTNLNSSISDMGPIVLTQIATGLSVLAGAALLKSVMDQNPMMGPGSGEPRCSRCNGTGRVTCLCNRWSDGDRGCRTCAGSGRMMCSSCGGSGTGRPLPVRISVRPPNQPY